MNVSSDMPWAATMSRTSRISPKVPIAIALLPSFIT